MSSVYKKGRAVVEANLTPMIDVTFLLIVFFVLVSQIVDVEQVDMNLPDPYDPKTMMMPDERRVIVNVVPLELNPGEIKEYRIGARVFEATPEGIDQMASHLAGLYQQTPEININLRADRATHYEWVQPAMQAVTLAASRVDNPDIVPRINLVVVRDE